MKLTARFFPEALRPYAGRICLTLLGFLVGILFLTIGFWRTALLVVLCGAGYLLGMRRDGALNLDNLPIPARWK